MARVIQHAVLGSPSVLAGGAPTPRWYFLMTDGTMWMLTGGVWTQAPVIPGARVVSTIQVSPGDTVYAACTDGTIWAAVVTAPFTWAQVATTP